MPEQIANQAQTALTAELAKGATTLTVASAARFPTEGQFRILIDSELTMVTAVEGTTFTVERGIEETTDVVHVSGSTVTQVLTAAGFATKADLEEGKLLESEIPDTVATGEVADKGAGKIMYVRSDDATTGWVEPPPSMPRRGESRRKTPTTAKRWPARSLRWRRSAASCGCPAANWPSPKAFCSTAKTTKAAPSST